MSDEYANNDSVPVRGRGKNMQGTPPELREAASQARQAENSLLASGPCEPKQHSARELADLQAR